MTAGRRKLRHEFAGLIWALAFTGVLKREWLRFSSAAFTLLSALVRPCSGCWSLPRVSRSVGRLDHGAHATYTPNKTYISAWAVLP